MLDAYIINDIKKREEERRLREELNRPRLHIEIDDPRRPPSEPVLEDVNEYEPEEDDAPVRIDLSPLEEAQ